MIALHVSPGPELPSPWPHRVLAALQSWYATAAITHGNACRSMHRSQARPWQQQHSSAIARRGSALHCQSQSPPRRSAAVPAGHRLRLPRRRPTISLRRVGYRTHAAHAVLPHLLHAPTDMRPTAVVATAAGQLTTAVAVARNRWPLLLNRP